MNRDNKEYEILQRISKLDKNINGRIENINKNLNSLKEEIQNMNSYFNGNKNSNNDHNKDSKFGETSVYFEELENNLKNLLGKDKEEKIKEINETFESIIGNINMDKLDNENLNNFFIQLQNEAKENIGIIENKAIEAKGEREAQIGQLTKEMEREMQNAFNLVKYSFNFLYRRKYKDEK